MWNRKFGRNADHRKAMLRNLATSVIMYGKVETTYAKAMDMRSVVDELITLGKKGDLSARRQAAAFIPISATLLLMRRHSRQYCRSCSPM